jgi:hypothetical protein
MSAALTPVDMAKQYHAVTGEPAKFEPVPLDSVLEFFRTNPEMGGPGVAKEMEDMFKRVSNLALPRPTSQKLTPIDAYRSYINGIEPGTTCTGWMKPEDDHSFEDLGIKATTFEAWLERTGWRVGGAMVK